MGAPSTRTLAFLAAATTLLASAGGCGDPDAYADPVNAYEAIYLDEAAKFEADTAFALALSPSTDELSAARALPTDASPPASFAEATARRVRERYAPSSCVDAIVTGSDLVYTLTDCAGPLGASRLNGTIRVTFAATDEGLAMHASAESLDVGDLDVRLDLRVVLSGGGARARLESAMAIRGLTGRVTSREAQGSLAWRDGETCATHTAIAETVINERPVQEIYADVVRCAGQCARSGSLAIVAGASTKVIRYGGTRAPEVTAGAPVALRCEGAP